MDIKEIEIHFGTDGWRGRIGDDFTFANVRRCAQGFADYLASRVANDSEKRVVIGYDTRFASEDFAAVAAEVMAANGFKVYLAAKATPTPALSYHTVLKKAKGCINITASHNPGRDNGFKVRDENGGSIPPENLHEIESLIPSAFDSRIKRIALKDAISTGKVEYFDGKPEYIARIKELIDLEPIKNAGLKILVDYMWGNGAGWLSDLLQGGQTQVIEIHAHRNPVFPEMDRPEPIRPNVDSGLKYGKEIGANAICILDGDSDRCGFGDENGEFIDQLRVFGLLAFYMLEIRKKRGAIVKTLSTTSMLDKLAKIYDVPVVSTAVGFKYIAPAMLEQENPLIGGEESGGYAFQGHVPERDGILANLYMLDFMVKTGKTPTELIRYLFDKVGEHYYKRIDVILNNNEEKVVIKSRLDKTIKALPQTLGGLRVVDLITIDGYRYSMEDGGWLLIRFSDTEPKLRIYTETTVSSALFGIIEDGKKIALEDL